MDTIGDFITIIRNAKDANLDHCSAQYSKIREGIVKLLTSEGYINGFSSTETSKGLKSLKVDLKYVDEVPAFQQIQRVSKPSRRIYVPCSEIPKVLGGMGVSILSTSKGILTGVQARKEKVGGELLCKIW